MLDTTDSLIQKRERLIAAGRFGDRSRGGVFNPGGLEVDGQIHLLCCAEASDATWTGAFRKTRAAAFWCCLDENMKLRGYRELSQYAESRQRPEDWRLFRHDGRIFSNHSVYSWNDDLMSCHVAVSEIDLERGHIGRGQTFKTSLAPRLQEKNWAMFSHRGRLLCIYSIDPYIVLEIGLETGEAEVALTGGAFDFALSYRSGVGLFNSTNPILWDEDHYLTFFHTYMKSSVPGDRNRLYLQYAMLIDQETLLPVGVTPDPVVAGGGEDGLHPGVHYTMSLAKFGDDLCAFYGEGDMHTRLLVIDRDGLNQKFRPAGQ